MKNKQKKLRLLSLIICMGLLVASCSTSENHSWDCAYARFALKGTVYSAQTNEALPGIMIDKRQEDYAYDDFYMDSYSAIYTDANGYFELSLTGEYSPCIEQVNNHSKSGLYYIYFFDPDSNYQSTDTLLGIVAYKDYGERDIVIYMNKSK